MKRARMIAAMVVFGLGACASAPPKPGTAGAVADGRQWLEVTTVRWVSIADPGPGRGWVNLSSARYEALPGARCTASNDMGTWSVVTPGMLEVTLSAKPLTVVCHLPGYQSQTRILRCFTPATRAALAATGAVGMAGGPLVLLVAPIFGAASLIGAAEGPEDGCVYEGAPLQVEMITVR